MQLSNLERDGEQRSFSGHGHAILGSAGGLSLMRGVFEPGWRWSNDVAPIAGTDSCQTRTSGPAATQAVLVGVQKQTALRPDGSANCMRIDIQSIYDAQ